MKLTVLAGTYSIFRFAPYTPIPEGMERASFYTVSRTATELSIVCDGHLITAGFEKRQDGWKCLKVDGTLDFSLTGILASIANPLATAKVSIFAISTFDTDYVLLQENQLPSAVQALTQVGFEVSEQVCG